jgi:hypothetical protein
MPCTHQEGRREEIEHTTALTTSVFDPHDRLHGVPCTQTPRGSRPEADVAFSYARSSIAFAAVILGRHLRVFHSIWDIGRQLG